MNSLFDSIRDAKELSESIIDSSVHLVKRDDAVKPEDVSLKQLITNVGIYITAAPEVEDTDKLEAGDTFDRTNIDFDAYIVCGDVNQVYETTNNHISTLEYKPNVGKNKAKLGCSANNHLLVKYTPHITIHRPKYVKTAKYYISISGGIYQRYTSSKYIKIYPRVRVNLKHISAYINSDSNISDIYYINSSKCLVNNSLFSKYLDSTIRVNSCQKIIR